MQLEAALDAPSLPWSALLAWLSAAVCGGLAWRRRQALEPLAPPEREQLVNALLPEPAMREPLEDGARRVAIFELNQRLADVAFELEILPATFTALIRISLASAAGIALVGFVSSAGQPPLERGLGLGLAASAGFIGAGAVLVIGRGAKVRAGQIRESWDRSSRDIGKALGTSLATGAGIRGNAR